MSQMQDSSSVNEVPKEDQHILNERKPTFELVMVTSLAPAK